MYIHIYIYHTHILNFSRKLAGRLNRRTFDFEASDQIGHVGPETLYAYFHIFPRSYSGLSPLQQGGGGSPEMKLRMIRTFTRNYSVQRNFPAIIGHSAGTRKYPCIICMIESCMIFGLSMVEIKIKKKKKKKKVKGKRRRGRETLWRTGDS